MKLLVGLGNPGEKYHNTRHNVGFMILDHVFHNLGPYNTDWSANSKLKSDIASFTVSTDKSGEEKVILAKPQTYMNDSGRAVKLLVDFYKVDPANLWIAYDELDLPLGSMKIRLGGAAAGHHGVESIMESLGTDTFWRFRFGIGESYNRDRTEGKQFIRDAKEYVLQPFQDGEQGKIRKMLKHGAEAIQVAITKNLETAMNRYNSK